jgi:signal transduction histidine kinase
MAEVSVIDEGIGIPAEEQVKVFDRFYQVDSGENRSFPGTGLGLYITSELLHAMGGTIRVESEPGKGSTFTFALPLAGRAGVAEGQA